VGVLLNKGDGTFAAEHDYQTGLSPVSVTVADLNGDGRPDLVVSNGGLMGTSTVNVLINTCRP
jgi:hypothetical protein